MGNLNSVQISLNYLAIKNDVIDNPKNIFDYSHIVLPELVLLKSNQEFKKKWFF